MDRIFLMVIKDSDGKITDIREGKWFHFFRQDGSFTSENRRLIQDNLQEGGDFNFGPKK